MDPFTAWLAKRGAGWWMANRPFSRDKRGIRKERRRIRKENRRRKKEGLDPLPLPKEPLMETGFRTSTVAGVTGVVAYVLMKVLGIVAPDLVVAVPGLEESVAGVFAYFAARFNKTPDEPGAV